MKLRVPALAIAASAAAVATVSSSQAEVASDSRAAQKLASALQGRTAGNPVSCVGNLRGQARMEVIDDWTILYRDGPTVFVQKTREACPGLKNGRYSLVTHKFGSKQICSNDINQMIDLQTGVSRGSCRFGPFVPYRRMK